VVEIDSALTATLPDLALEDDRPLVDAGAAPPVVPVDSELAPHRIRVSAGRQAIVGHDEARQVLVAEVDKMEEKLSWRTGMLTFDREPLESVVAEVSRYTTLRFIIPEKQVREMVVGGVFKVGDTESLFEALQLGFGIRAEEVADNVVYLSLASDGG
jgi:transmembrane sensor